VTTTTAAERLKTNRLSIGVSQSKLARVSGVARFKICTFELGSGCLSPEEQGRIKLALEAEAARLRSIATRLFDDSPWLPAGAPPHGYGISNEDRVPIGGTGDEARRTTKSLVIADTIARANGSDVES
jgi:hypothetical protein